MSSKLFTVLEFAAHLHAVERDMHEVGPKIIAKACEMVCNEARRVLGTHDYGWPELKPETIARKIRGDTPLLETGAMRDSITWTAKGNEGQVGTDSQIAVYQELGTSKIPPRPFLAGAAQHMEEKIHKMAARATIAVMMGRGLASAEMRELLELLHLVKEVAKSVKENLVDPVLEDDDKQHRQRR